MKKLILPLLLTMSTIVSAQPALNVELFGEINRGDIRYSGSWFYVSPDNVEYALIGTRTGVAANRMDDASLPEVGFIAGPESNWREITVIDQHAYVTTEGTGAGEGMQVIDLSYLPDSMHLVTTYDYDGIMNRGHIIQKNNYIDESYIYVNGGCGSCGILILDISNPAEPTLVGEYQPGYYIHDCFIKNDRIFACAFFESTIDVIDISDKTNPTLITTIPDPGSNTHSVWLTEDDRHLVVCDELDGLPSRILNVEDVENPYVVGPTYTADPVTLVHNPYIVGRHVFFSHNSAGLTIVDIRDPALPVQVGNYDTWEGASGGSTGLWSACPFPPSGKIIGGDRTKGLFVWTFNNTEAGRFYGVVKDSLTGAVLMDATVLLQPNNETLSLDFDGIFKFGALAFDGYELNASVPGYVGKTISFDTAEGDSLWIEIELVPDGWVSVDAVNQVETLSAFPNPTTGAFVIDLNELPEGRMVEVFSVNGALVKQLAIRNSLKINIDLTSQNAGVYLVNVLDETGRVLAEAKVVRE